MSSPIRQEATFCVYKNPDRFKVKFSSLGDWYDVFTVNIHGGNTIGTTCVVDRDDTAYMVVDREFRLPTE